VPAFVCGKRGWHDEQSYVRCEPCEKRTPATAATVVVEASEAWQSVQVNASRGPRWSCCTAVGVVSAANAEVIMNAQTQTLASSRTANFASPLGVVVTRAVICFPFDTRTDTGRSWS